MNKRVRFKGRDNPKRQALSEANVREIITYLGRGDEIGSYTRKFREVLGAHEALRDASGPEPAAVYG